MLDHQSGKSKGPKPLPHKPQQQNHPFYTPFTAGEHEQRQGDGQWDRTNAKYVVAFMAKGKA